MGNSDRGLPDKRLYEGHQHNSRRRTTVTSKDEISPGEPTPMSTLPSRGFCKHAAIMQSVLFDPWLGSED